MGNAQNGHRHVVFKNEKKKKNVYGRQALLLNAHYNSDIGPLKFCWHGTLQNQLSKVEET